MSMFTLDDARHRDISRTLSVLTVCVIVYNRLSAFTPSAYQQLRQFSTNFPNSFSGTLPGRLATDMI